MATIQRARNCSFSGSPRDLRGWASSRSSEGSSASGDRVPELRGERPRACSSSAPSRPSSRRRGCSCGSRRRCAGSPRSQRSTTSTGTRRAGQAGEPARHPTPVTFRSRGTCALRRRTVPDRLSQAYWWYRALISFVSRRRPALPVEVARQATPRPRRLRRELPDLAGYDLVWCFTLPSALAMEALLGALLGRSSSTSSTIRPSGWWPAPMRRRGRRQRARRMGLASRGCREARGVPTRPGVVGVLVQARRKPSLPRRVLQSRRGGADGSRHGGRDPQRLRGPAVPWRAPGLGTTRAPLRRQHAELGQRARLRSTWSGRSSRRWSADSVTRSRCGSSAWHHLGCGPSAPSRVS